MPPSAARSFQAGSSTSSLPNGGAPPSYPLRPHTAKNDTSSHTSSTARQPPVASRQSPDASRLPSLAVDLAATLFHRHSSSLRERSTRLIVFTFVLSTHAGTKGLARTTDHQDCSVCMALTIAVTHMLIKCCASCLAAVLRGPSRTPPVCLSWWWASRYRC